MKNLILHTPNNKGTHYRFNNYYDGEEDNYDRLSIVAIPDEVNKTLSLGVAFCTYPDNFSRGNGVLRATKKAYTTPYAVITVEDFTMANCLEVLYELHQDLISRSVRGVKALVATQVVK